MNPLRELLALLAPGTRRDTVVVLGAGLNLQATAGVPGHDEPGWSDLIHQVAFDLGLAVPYPRPTSMLAWWELLISELARSHGTDASDAEEALQEAVAARLIGSEARTAKAPLYRSLMESGFRDLVSYSFDRRLALSVGATMHRTEAAFDEPARHANALAMYDQGPDTRVWYPHGHTASPRTIKTGARQYGSYISALEEARVSFKQRERTGPEQTGDWQGFRAGIRLQPESWFDLFLLSDLVFVGMGMGSDEWDLWWSLHQRERNFARHPDERPHTYLLLTGQDGPVGRPAGLDVIEFPSRAMIWHLLVHGTLP